MTKPTKSYRLSTATLDQIAALAERFGSQSNVITIAVDRMYREEKNNMMNSHNPNAYEITAKEGIEDIDEQASLELWTIVDDEGDELQIAVIFYHLSGIGFTVRDWQGQQPESVEEIQDFPWVSFDGQDAIMMEGLPVLLG